MEDENLEEFQQFVNNGHKSINSKINSFFESLGEKKL